MGGCVGKSRRVAPGDEKDGERPSRIVRRLKVRMPAAEFEELMAGADAAEAARVIVEGCLRGRWELRVGGGVSISSLEIISEEIL